MSRRFPLGKVVATPGRSAPWEPRRKSRWICSAGMPGAIGARCVAEDAQENNLSVDNEMRILSSYTLSTRVKVWVITEADRSSTCILLPEEY